MVTAMAVNRVSTSLIRYLGAEVSPTSTRGALRNKIRDGQGIEIVQPADTQRVFNTGLTPASVNVSDFDAARGYFENRGATPLAAKAMALVMADIAKHNGVSVMKLVDDSDKQNIKLLEAETYRYINQLRDGTSQLSGSAPTDNKKSVRARYLLA